MIREIHATYGTLFCPTLFNALIFKGKKVLFSVQAVPLEGAGDDSGRRRTRHGPLLRPGNELRK